jgi:hypothetical protein
MGTLPAHAAARSTAHPDVALHQSYEDFLAEIKDRIRSAQARAARALSAELTGRLAEEVEQFQEIEDLRRVERQVAEFTARRAGELTQAGSTQALSLANSVAVCT